MRLTAVEIDDRGCLPFDDDEFDIVLLTTDATRKLAPECERVTCKGGAPIPSD